MKDFIPKGTGNSRFLKSAIGASTTWEQFRDLLRGGTAPIDLNGVNPLGVDEIGTALNKASLLTDETSVNLGLDPVSDPSVDDAFNSLYSKKDIMTESTAALYGLVAEAVPDDVFSLVKPLLDSKAVFVSGTYTGNGTTIGIDLGFRPSAVLIGGVSGFDASTGGSGNKPVGGLILNNVPNVHGGTSLSVVDNGFRAVQGVYSSDQWYAVNLSGQLYKYIALR